MRERSPIWMTGPYLPATLTPCTTRVTGSTGSTGGPVIFAGIPIRLLHHSNRRPRSPLSHFSLPVPVVPLPVLLYFVCRVEYYKGRKTSVPSTQDRPHMLQYRELECERASPTAAVVSPTLSSLLSLLFLPPSLPFPFSPTLRVGDNTCSTTTAKKPLLPHAPKRRHPCCGGGTMTIILLVQTGRLLCVPAW